MQQSHRPYYSLVLPPSEIHTQRLNVMAAPNLLREGCTELTWATASVFSTFFGYFFNDSTVTSASNQHILGHQRLTAFFW